MMRLGLLVLALVAPAAPDTAQLFDAAIKREASGDFAGAATALEALGRAHPGDAYADDALYEAAQLYDERLDGPDRARTLYAEILSRYPDSRLARRAQHRVEDLTRALQSGSELLVQYQRILADGGHLERALPAMASFVAAHPEFALTDQARFWLGERLTELGRYAEADARFREVEGLNTELAERAKSARGQLDLLRGRPFAARAVYATLTSSTDPLIRAAAKEGLARVDVAVEYDVLLAIALTLLALWLGWALIDGRGQSWAAPVELYYYVPVALLFLLAAATENRAIGVATLGIALGGAGLTWLSARATARGLLLGPITSGARTARAFALAGAGMALAYSALFFAGLLDLIWATFRFGPDR